jgi:hypothetical protein
MNIELKNKMSIMKFDGFPGEKEILSFRLINGCGWLTTRRLVIEQEKHNPRFNILERQDPEMYFLRDFEKAEIEGETLIVHFKGWKIAMVRLAVYSPSLLQEIKDYIEEAAKYCR